MFFYLDEITNLWIVELGPGIISIAFMRVFSIFLKKAILSLIFTPSYSIFIVFKAILGYPGNLTCVLPSTITISPLVSSIFWKLLILGLLVWQNAFIPNERNIIKRNFFILLIIIFLK